MIEQQGSARMEEKVISGFWRRVLAFALDGILLGLVGFALGMFFFDAFARLGGWGRLLGFCLALGYYGILNSVAGKGRTIGKRIVGIEVVNRDGQHISPGLSILRYTVLAVPFFLNGAIIPPSVATSPLGYVLGLCVFGLGGAVIYLYIFNRRTRQSLHDLICGTFVVRSAPNGKVPDSPVWKPHVVVTVVWLAVTLAAGFMTGHMTQKGIFPAILATQEAILSSGNVHAATVSVGRTWSTSGHRRLEFTYITSNAIWKKRPADYETAAKEVAAIIMERYPDVMTKGMLTVTVTYGYDIGIARCWRSRTFQHPPSDWRLIAGHPATRL